MSKSVVSVLWFLPYRLVNMLCTMCMCHVYHGYSYICTHLIASGMKKEKSEMKNLADCTCTCTIGLIHKKGQERRLG